MTVLEIKDLLGVAHNRKCEVVTITPACAKILLDETNTNNRRLRPNEVKYYSKNMKCGSWDFNPDGISWNDDGVLTNGQHRLNAVIRSNKAIETVVVFGVNTSMGIDNGASRSFQDNVRISNLCCDKLRDETKLQSVFDHAYRLRSNGTQVTKRQIVYDKMIKSMNYHKDELIACQKAGLFQKNSAKGCDMNAIKAVFFLAYLTGVSLDLLSHIAEVLRTGVVDNKDLDKPIIGLRDYLMKNSDGSGREQLYKRVCAVTCCIKKMLDGRKTKTIKLKDCYSYNFDREV